jgi:hypothetical protein
VAVHLLIPTVAVVGGGTGGPLRVLLQGLRLFVGKSGDPITRAGATIATVWFSLRLYSQSQSFPGVAVRRTPSGLRDREPTPRPVALRSVLRKNSQAVPWNWLAPERIATLVTPPPTRPSNRKLLYVLRIPVMLIAPSRGVPLGLKTAANR